MGKPRLLCIAPSPGSPRNYGRVTSGLLPRWAASGAFDQIDLCPLEPYHPLPGDSFAILGDAESQFEDRLKLAKDNLDNGAYTHVWVCASAEASLRMAAEGLNAKSYQDVLFYVYPWIGTPFLEPALAGLLDWYDFVDVYNFHVASELRELVIQRPPFAKQRLIDASRVGVIEPGVSDAFLSPNDIPHQDIPGLIDPEDNQFVIVMNGPKRLAKGLPHAMRIVQMLLVHGIRARLFINAVERFLPHQPFSVAQFASGHGLEYGRDVVCASDENFSEHGNPLRDDAYVVNLYRQANLVLVPNLADGWSFTAAEAMAVGSRVAVPAAYFYQTLVERGAIPMPTSDFDYLPHSRAGFCAAINPYFAARNIHEAVELPTPTYPKPVTWNAAAAAWLERFAVV